jgi:hypothetical protein
MLDRAGRAVERQRLAGQACRDGFGGGHRSIDARAVKGGAGEVDATSLKRCVKLAHLLAVSGGQHGQ